MSFPGIFRRLFEKEGAGPLLRKEIIPPHADTHTADGDDPIDITALGGARASALAALQQQVAELAEAVADEHLEEWRKSWIGVPRPWRSTTLPANHCYANGDFISFSDWPELQTVSDSGGLAGMLLPWDADSATQAAYLGMWRPDAALPSGLYTPTLAGKFLQSWTPGGGSAGSYTSAGLPDIGGFASGLLMSVTPDSGGALLLYGATGPDVQTINGDVNPWGYVDFKASRSNSIYGSSTSVMPESIALPYIIYLGQPA